MGINQPSAPIRWREKMDVREMQECWNGLGKSDPLWAILTEPEKGGGNWQIDEFMDTGINEIGAVMEYVDSLGIRLPRNKALDFGCGVGRLTQALADHFDEVHGVDIAPSMIALADKYNSHGEKCTYHVNVSSDLRLFADGSFDFIYSNITLQHIKPRYSKKYIQEYLRILNPNGLLIFQLPSGRRGKTRFIRLAIAGILYRLNRMIGARCLRLLPKMEMYGIKQQKVVEFLNGNGAIIVDVVQDQGAGPNWTSWRYCVAKGKLNGED